MRTSIRAPATIHPLPGGEAIVAAPAAGRFSAAVLLSIGDRVSSGQILGQIEPRLAAGPDRATLVADVAEATAAVEAARVEKARAERLLADRAVPARRVEDASRTLGVVEARLSAAEARLVQRDETLRTDHKSLWSGASATATARPRRAPRSSRPTARARRRCRSDRRRRAAASVRGAPRRSAARSRGRRRGRSRGGRARR